jgi:hypothetical protein
MKTTTRALLAATLAGLLAPTAPLRAEDPPKTTSGTFELGGYGTSVDGTPDKAMEYEPTGNFAPWKLLLSSHEFWGSIFLSSEANGTDSQKHRLSFDVQRAVRVKGEYDRVPHSLPHDPMTNLTAAVSDGKYVWNTDTAPGTNYQVSYSNLGGRAEVQLPSLSAATLGLNYREQRRTGHAQLMTLSHCESCHVTSQSRSVDEKTRDAGADLLMAFKGGALRVGYNHRELTNGDPYAQLTYDRALHPVQHTPIFDNRLQFDATEGPQKVDYRPDTRKNTGTLDFSIQDLAGFALNGVGVVSQTENRYAGLEASYAGGAIALARNWESGLRLRWRTRYYALDSDDVAVDSVERVSVAGPQAGKTYRQVYGYDPDFVRQSALNRDVYESNLEAAFRLGKKLGTVRAIWNFQNQDRKTYEVAPGQTTTTTNVLGLAWRAQVAKSFRLNADYRHGDASHAFLAVDATCSQLFYPKSGTSGLDTSLAQYFMSHAARTGDGTADPSQWDEAKAGLSWISGSLGLTASYRWWSGSNRDGDFTDWSKTNQSATVTLWSMPSPTWDWYVAYAFQKSELGGHTCVSLFDG